MERYLVNVLAFAVTAILVAGVFTILMKGNTVDEKTQGILDAIKYGTSGECKTNLEKVLQCETKSELFKKCEIARKNLEKWTKKKDSPKEHANSLQEYDPNVNNGSSNANSNPSSASERDNTKFKYDIDPEAERQLWLKIPPNERPNKGVNDVKQTTEEKETEEKESKKDKKKQQKSDADDTPDEKDDEKTAEEKEEEKKKSKKDKKAKKEKKRKDNEKQQESDSHGEGLEPGHGQINPGMPASYSEPNHMITTSSISPTNSNGNNDISFVPFQSPNRDDPKENEKPPENDKSKKKKEKKKKHKSHAENDPSNPLPAPTYYLPAYYPYPPPNNYQLPPPNYPLPPPNYPLPPPFPPPNVRINRNQGNAQLPSPPPVQLPANSQDFDCSNYENEKQQCEEAAVKVSKCGTPYSGDYKQVPASIGVQRAEYNPNPSQPHDDHQLETEQYYDEEESVEPIDVTKNTGSNGRWW